MSDKVLHIPSDESRSDQVTQKHAAEAGNTWMQYASGTDRKPAPTKPTGRTVDTDVPNDLQSDTIDEAGTDAAASMLFNLDPPVRPYDMHLETIREAATALDEARDAIRVAGEQLAQVVLQGRLAGLSWAKISATLGISRQYAYQRWATRLREMDDSAITIAEANDQSQAPFGQ
jgi:DNA-directed RNA polymerase specialized sigma24 family protein